MWSWSRMDSYNSLLFLQAIITLTRFMVPASQAYHMDFVDEAKRGIANGIFNLDQQIGGTVVGLFMFTEQKMDQKGLSSLLGEQSKMVMQSSPEAAAMANQFLATEEKKSSGGIMGWLKKLFGS